MENHNSEKAIQDYFPPKFCQCYGCGKLNEHGLQIKSYWDGEESVCHFQPKDYHIAFPGFVYGGLIASLIDCHSIGTASAAAYEAEGRPFESDPPLRYVTASLKVDFLKPTPLGPVLELRAKAIEVKDRKVILETTLSAEGKVCARGEVIAVKYPETMM